MSKKEVIRVMDWVRITNPVFFDRVAYEINIDDETERFKKEYPLLVPCLSNLAVGDQSAAEGVYRALAYASVGKARKDGAVRKLFTHEDPALLNRVEIVHDKKTVWTGIYESAFIGSDDDYTPAMLMHPKAHVLLKLRTGHWIEEIHVTKLNKYVSNEHNW